MFKKSHKLAPTETTLTTALPPATSPWYAQLILCCIVFVNLTIFCDIVMAQDYLPIATRHLNPFILPYSSAAALTDSAESLQPGTMSSNIRLFIANNSIAMDKGTEQIILDGESYVTDIQFNYGYDRQWEFAVSVPIIYHNDGFLDNAIETWHDWLGLSNGRRQDFPSNELLYQYRDNGATQFEIDSAAGGVGDIVLSTQYHPTRFNTLDKALTYKLDIKLPTGQAEKLTGSEAFDISLSAHALNRQMLRTLHLSLYGGAGATYLGEGDILPDIQNDFIYSGYLGTVWRFHPKFNLKAQIDYHSAFYDSALVALGSDSVALYLGGTYITQKHISYELGFGENLQTDPTPDFIIYFTINYTPTHK